jgi:hypothetical protein
MGKLHRNADLMANVIDELKEHVTLHRVAQHTEDRHTS